jgi:DNA primase
MQQDQQVFGAATQYLQDTLFQPARRGIVARLEQEKGIAPGVMETFQVGYYCDPETLRDGLLSMGLPRERIHASGVLRRDVNNSITIPWRDCANGPHGMIYRREAPLMTRTPHGLQPVRYALAGDRSALPPMGLEGIVHAPVDHAILVEGTFDFLALWGAGARDVLGINSCFVRPAQMRRVLLAGVKCVTICFDGDFPGRRGALLSIEAAHAFGMDARVQLMPPKLDIDEYLLAHGLKAWRAMLAQASDGYGYYAAALIEAFANQSSQALLHAAGRFCALGEKSDARDEILADRLWRPIAAHTRASWAQCMEAERLARADPSARHHISPIGSLLKNRTGSLHPFPSA